MKRRTLLLAGALLIGRCFLHAQDISLSSERLHVSWNRHQDGWHINRIEVNGRQLLRPEGYFTILYLNRRPAGNLVDLDLEGEALSFYPANAGRGADGAITFSQQLPAADITSTWKADPDYPTDIRVQVTVTAKKKGFFAIGTPTIACIAPEELGWGMIPGNWYGRELQPDFQLATRYSMGVPNVPYLAKERNTMTLSPMITTKEKITLAVIPDPGTAADPWAYDASTRNINKLGMSLMNRHNELSPTAYSPVLGQEGSALEAGDTATFSFRYSIQNADWFPVFRHAVLDIYQFPAMLDLQQNKRSLSERVSLMQQYLHDKKKSAWRTWRSGGLEIGANGTKNADIGAMWMIAYAGHDTAMQQRLPFVRNYKLVQQQTTPGFFEGAGMGEYADEDGVESERGNWVEPLFTTYYTLMDMGNMLLFKPDDAELKKRVRLAADKLLAWQHADGGWDVAYDRFSRKLTFPDLKDLRPTWYGLLVAYRILGDDKYLRAAQKGADWLIKNGVDKGYYLGVCGDARNIWDFATAQCAQSFLDLYAITKNSAYQKAAIEAAEIYATSIFTQPVATNKEKMVAGTKRKDWEINQSGLSVEHIRGTAGSGPILISSFTGLFIRIFELTRDSLFLYMARAAARGRDAYVDENGQSIYYWNGLDKIQQQVRAFPHHAFWQIGWITDYLLSEALLRSEGKVSFPAGFMTPKVGPHISYGFAPGTVFGHPAKLLLTAGLLKCDNPDLEYFAATGENDSKLYVIVLNQSTKAQHGTLNVLPARKAGWVKAAALQGRLAGADRNKGKLDVQLPAWGMNVIALDL